jgi:hypothetical protein
MKHLGTLCRAWIFKFFHREIFNILKTYQNVSWIDISQDRCVQSVALLIWVFLEVSGSILGQGVDYTDRFLVRLPISSQYLKLGRKHFYQISSSSMLIVIPDFWFHILGAIDSFGK